MKNILENKAKFFAQYFGQNVLCYFFRDGIYEKEKVEVDYPILECLDKYKDTKLELKPLSQISDEDAIKISELRGFVNIKSIKTDYNGFWVRFLGNEHTKWVFFNELYQPEIDYIRSKGYALPWNGITIEEMIEFEWIKLKE